MTYAQTLKSKGTAIVIAVLFVISGGAASIVSAAQTDLETQLVSVSGTTQSDSYGTASSYLRTADTPPLWVKKYPLGAHMPLMTKEIRFTG